MKQTVLLGLGGTGSRVVNNVAKILQEKDIVINDGIVTCAVLDTNQSDNDLISGSGTGIPVIPTCDERTIDQYLAIYAGKNPRTWCPYSESFGQETMIDGASELRVKSRIAFMDTMESDKIDELKAAIGRVFHHRNGEPEKVRVMLVSSLAGGTGSGSFIQVALWLRKFFAERNCLATIRGVFLLPDIFVENCDSVKKNPRKKLYHYANAYAAIRELNAINKVIKRNYTPDRRIIIDGLFDSDNPTKKPVFDNAFFIDNVDANGASFNTVSAYEKMVAQIVYMQLYAPMQSELYSVEDNLYRSFERSPEPIYGSCGTARAEYPAKAVAKYCALRAAADSIREGWSRIDSEIDDLIAEEKNAEKDGFIPKNRVVRRDMFVKLFDEKSNKTGNQVGAEDRLFVSIKNDVFNESRKLTGKGNETTPDNTCKVAAFMSNLESRITAYVKDNGGCKKITSLVASLPAATDTENAPSNTHVNFSEGLVNTLKGLPEQELTVIQSVVKNFEENGEEAAKELIRAIVPLDMGSINRNDECSLFGIFQKKDANGNVYFVHPVAAKYLLYKLSCAIEEKQSTLAVEDRKKKALKGDDKVSFDNPKTRKKETLREYWKQLGLVTSKSEIQHFINAYRKYNTANDLLCKQFEAELLTQLVLKSLGEYVTKLIASIEVLFRDFRYVEDKINEDIDDNVDENENDLEKVLYVFAKREHKEFIYDSLNIDLTGRNDDLYRELVEAVYGSFCVTERPNAKSNKKYEGVSVIESFYNSLVGSFTDLVSTNSTYRDLIYFDIVDAIYKETDYEYEKSSPSKAVSGNPFNGANEKALKDKRREDAIDSYRNKLLTKAKPFLRVTPSEMMTVREDKDGITVDENSEIWMTTYDGTKILVPIQTKLTFWGFHPDIVEKCPAIEAKLGANKATSSSAGYGPNELYCYSSIYGIKAEEIPKFNEQGGGDYYKYYSAVLNDMLRSKSEIDTPHIDKTWHEFLPYVSSTKQNSSQQVFFKAFWKAIAYGRICLDRSGNYQIALPKRDSYGKINYKKETLFEDGREISAAEVDRLIIALMNTPVFELEMAEKLEEAYEEDIKGMTTYIGTKVISGLVTEGNLNPVTMITRYSKAKGSIVSVRDDLVGALGVILNDVASHYNLNREERQIEDAKIKLCYRIYEKCNMTSKTLLLEYWGDDFKRLKLIADDTVTDGDDGGVVEDII